MPGRQTGLAQPNAEIPRVGVVEAVEDEFAFLLLQNGQQLGGISRHAASFDGGMEKA